MPLHLLRCLKEKFFMAELAELRLLIDPKTGITGNMIRGSDSVSSVPKHVSDEIKR